MDGEQVYLTDSEKNHFRNYEEMFRSAGWRQLITELQEEIKQSPDETFWTATSYDQLVLARLKASQYNLFISYPDIIEQRKATLVANREQMVEEELTGQRANV